MKIRGERHYLWRAVDQDGDVIDILVQLQRPRGQTVLSVHGVIRNRSNLGRHQLSSANYRLLRERSFKEWSAATTA